MELVNIGLMTVPYVLSSSKPDDHLAGQLLKRTDSLTRVKHKMQSLLNPFNGNDAPYEARAKGTHVSTRRGWYKRRELRS